MVPSPGILLSVFSPVILVSKLFFPPGCGGVSAISMSGSIHCIISVSYTHLDVYKRQECHQSWDAWGSQNDDKHTLPGYLTLTTEESKELTQIKTKLANYSDEMVYRFIFGEEDLETGWDGFVAQLKGLGSERGEEINAAAYARYEGRD